MIMSYMYLFLSACLLLVAANDIKTHKIPNYLVLIIIIGSLIGNAFFDVGISLMASSLGLIIGMGLMLPSYFLGSMGAGDVKLIAAIGTVTGYHKIIDVVLYSYLAMFLLAFIFIILKGDLIKLVTRYKMMLFGVLGGVVSYQKPSALEAAAQKIPLAPAIGIAALYVIFPENWYY